jgi:ribosomal protein S18 acetylase RimI-like enzyme
LKAISESLNLSVFTENTGGILFYHREGFFIVKRRYYLAAGNEVLLMNWTRSKADPCSTR